MGRSGVNVAFTAALLLPLTACGASPSPVTPVEQQKGLLAASADQPSLRASQMLGALKLGDEQRLQACLERYEADATPGRSWTWRSRRPGDGQHGRSRWMTRPAGLYRDGWVDRGKLRAMIVPDDDNGQDARCLVCNYDMDDSAAQPLQLLGAETTDTCS